MKRVVTALATSALVLAATGSAASAQHSPDRHAANLHSSINGHAVHTFTGGWSGAGSSSTYSLAGSSSQGEVTRAHLYLSLDQYQHHLARTRHNCVLVTLSGRDQGPNATVGAVVTFFHKQGRAKPVKAPVSVSAHPSGSGSYNDAAVGFPLDHLRGNEHVWFTVDFLTKNLVDRSSLEVKILSTRCPR